MARSSTEAEYRVMASTSTKIIWLRHLLQVFNISISTPTPLFCDKTSALALTNNLVFHPYTKHINIDCHFIWEHIKSQELSIQHKQTQH